MHLLDSTRCAVPYHRIIYSSSIITYRMVHYGSEGSVLASDSQQKYEIGPQQDQIQKKNGKIQLEFDFQLPGRLCHRIFTFQTSVNIRIAFIPFHPLYQTAQRSTFVCTHMNHHRSTVLPQRNTMRLVPLLLSVAVAVKMASCEPPSSCRAA